MLCDCNLFFCIQITQVLKILLPSFLKTIFSLCRYPSSLLSSLLLNNFLSKQLFLSESLTFPPAYCNQLLSSPLKIQSFTLKEPHISSSLSTSVCFSRPHICSTLLTSFILTMCPNYFILPWFTLSKRLNINVSTVLRTYFYFSTSNSSYPLSLPPHSTWLSSCSISNRVQTLSQYLTSFSSSSYSPSVSKLLDHVPLCKTSPLLCQTQFFLYFCYERKDIRKQQMVFPSFQ